jgi:hypothetical protein
MNGFEVVQEIARTCDGKITSAGVLPDGSGFATMSMPLPKNHWLTADPDGFNVPPMPFRMGVGHPCRKGLQEALRAAGKYACRCATMNGKEMDFDPDALLQNLIVGFLGYHTENGFSSDDFSNPKEEYGAAYQKESASKVANKSLNLDAGAVASSQVVRNNRALEIIGQP